MIKVGFLTVYEYLQDNDVDQNTKFEMILDIFPWCPCQDSHEFLKGDMKPLAEKQKYITSFSQYPKYSKGYVFKVKQLKLYFDDGRTQTYEPNDVVKITKNAKRKNIPTNKYLTISGICKPRKSRVFYYDYTLEEVKN
jgi:hypothetical protein